MTDETCKPHKTYQLICESLEAELAVAEIEEVFEGGTEKVKNHGIVITFCSEPPNERHANATRKCLIDLRFVFELGMLGLHRFKFDGNFLARDNVDPEVDVTCRKRRSQRVARDDKTFIYAPKEPEPIFFPSLYLPPTRKSNI